MLSLILVACSPGHSGRHVEPIESPDAIAGHDTGPPSTTSSTTVDELTFIAVRVASGNNGCALISNGALACWGDAGWLDLVPPFSVELERVEIGGQDKCGIDTAGHLQCWCHDTPNDTACDAVPSGAFTDVSLSSTVGAARRADGTLRWFGTSDALRRSPPASEAPDDAFGDFVVQSNIACGVRLDGSITCWGLTHFFSPDEIADGDFGLGEAPPSDLAYTQVALGNRFGCGLDVDRELHCWGTDDWHVEFPDAPPGPFTQVSAGFYSACGLREDGQLECWGTDHLAPLPSIQTEAPAGEFRAVALGGYDACAITADGKSIVCWGDDDPTSPLPSL